jgi:hypothetical protein
VAQFVSAAISSWFQEIAQGWSPPVWSLSFDPAYLVFPVALRVSLLLAWPRHSEEMEIGQSQVRAG